jgi:hypothetical protein
MFGETEGEQEFRRRAIAAGYKVSRLKPEWKYESVTCVELNSQLKSAVTLRFYYDYSQLPVVAEDRRPPRQRLAVAQRLPR